MTDKIRMLLPFDQVKIVDGLPDNTPSLDIWLQGILIRMPFDAGTNRDLLRTCDLGTAKLVLELSGGHPQ